MSLMDDDDKTLIIVEGKKLFLPAEAAQKLVLEIHEKYHSAAERTIFTLQKGYFFPGLLQDGQQGLHRLLDLPQEQTCTEHRVRSHKS